MNTDDGPDDVFWSVPPTPMDALPADLQPGDEGTTIVPAVDPELLAYLQRCSNNLRDQGDSWVRPALDRVVDGMLGRCEVLTKQKELVVVRGDPERLRTLLAAMDEAMPVLRRIVAIQLDIGFV